MPRGLRSRIVAHDELVLVVRPDHRWIRRGSVITSRELSETPLVMRESGSGTRDYLTAALENLLGPGTGEATPAMEMSTSAAVRAAVLAGSAPAVLSRLAVSDDLAVGRLRVVPVSDLDLRRDLRAVWLGGRTPPAGAVRDLLGHIGSITRPTLSTAVSWLFARCFDEFSQPAGRALGVGAGPPGPSMTVTPPGYMVRARASSLPSV